MLRLICFLGYFTFLLSGSVFAVDDKKSELADDLRQQLLTDYNTFLDDTFESRLACFYDDQTMPDELRKSLLTKSKQTGIKLAAILNQQKMLLDAIEKDSASDWQIKYGSSGLWKQVKADVLTSTYYTLQTKYYYALASSDEVASMICTEIISQLDSVFSNSSLSQIALLRARTFALSKHEELRAKSLEITEEIIRNSQIYNKLYFQTWLERFKIENRKAEDIARVWRLLSRHLPDDKTLSFSFAVLQMRSGSTDIIKKTIGESLAHKLFFGSLLVSKFSTLAERDFRDQYADLDQFARELLGCFIYANPDQLKSPLLGNMVVSCDAEQFSLCAIAQHYQDSGDPTSALKFYIKASQSPQAMIDGILEKKEILTQANEYAYSLIQQDSKYASLCQQAVNSYLAANLKEPDYELLYYFAKEFQRLGDPIASEIFKYISRSDSEFSYYVRIDEIVTQFNSNDMSPDTNQELVLRTQQFLDDASSQSVPDRLILDALKIYGSLILDDSDVSDAEAFLRRLMASGFMSHESLIALSARAYLIIGEYERSISLLASSQNSDLYESYSVISSIMDKLEYYLDNCSDADVFLKDCLLISQRLYMTVDEMIKPDSGYMYAELLTLSGSQNTKQMQKLLSELSAFNTNNLQEMSGIRMRARLAFSRERFTESARLWKQYSQLAGAYSSKKWQWYCGKFHQLQSLAKAYPDRTDELAHSINVLIVDMEAEEKYWYDKYGFFAQKLNFDK